MTRLRLSVVTPVRDNLQCLELMLAGLRAQTLDRSRWEVVVVDDASAEPVQPLLAAAAGDLDITRVRLPARRGPGGARNAGAACASGDLLVFLDADVVAGPDLLRRHLDEHQTGDDRVVLGHRYESGRTTIARVGRGDLSRPDSPLEGDLRDQWLRGDPAYSRAPWLWTYSHNFSLPAELYAGVGGFDEGFSGWGHEDVELGYRLFLRLGRSATQFRYRRDAYGFHVPHYANAAANQQSGAQNLRYFKRKHLAYEVELYGYQWPGTVAAKVAHYERTIAELAAGRPATPPDLLRAYGDDASLLVIAAGPPGSGSGRVLHCDHSRPGSPENPHLLGIATGLDDDSFDTVVHIDLWRILATDDLTRMIGECLRLAPRLVLAQTAGGDDEVNYVGRMLAPRFPVRVTAVAGAVLVEVTRPGLAAAVVPVVADHHVHDAAVLAVRGQIRHPVDEATPAQVQ